MDEKEKYERSYGTEYFLWDIYGVRRSIYIFLLKKWNII